MNETTRQALMQALLDTLRKGMPADVHWPQGDAYEALRRAALGLVETALGDRDSNGLDDSDDTAATQGVSAPQPEPARDPLQCSSTTTDSNGHDDPDDTAATVSAPQPEPACDPLQCSSTTTDSEDVQPQQTPPTDNEDTQPQQTPAADPAQMTTATLRPGQIPHVPLSRARTEPIRLRVEIECNAREGEPYQSNISVHTARGEQASIVDCTIPDAAGVHFRDGSLYAESPRAGEYPVRLTCMLGGAAPAAGLVAEATLVVNHDPRTLWKNIPSDRDASGWKPDSIHHLIPAAADRRILVASERGRSHAHKGGFRDDDFAVRVTSPDGWNLIAVADGAGSAKRSRIGSRVAAETAVSVLAQQLAEGAATPLIEMSEANPADRSRAEKAAYAILAPAAFEAVKAIEAKARSQGGEPREYATTLLLAAHRRIVGGELVAAYWIGDGAIALFEQEGDVQLLGWPDGGEYAGQTRFLDRAMVTDGSEIMNRIKVCVVPRFDALLLMTDGVSDPCFPSDSELRDHAAWARLWEQLAPLIDDPAAGERLIDWLGFWSAGNHDDRTLALVW